MEERRRRFEALALPHLDAAYNLARWLTRSDADADDLVQEAMLRAFRAFDGFHGDSARPWLLAIVRNCFLSSIARKKREVPLPDDDAGDRLIADCDPEQEAATGDEAKKLQTVIAGLPADLREVLILREMEDMSYRDIATVIAAPIGTVMSRLSRAREALASAWQQKIEGVAHDVR